LGLEVVNVGPGIGIVDEFQLYLDGNALSGDWSDQWDTFRKATGTVDWTNRGGFLKGDPLLVDPTGRAEILLIVDENKYKKSVIRPDEWEALGKKLRPIAARLSVAIKYHSEYGEAFEITKEGLRPPRFKKRNLFGQYIDWEP
jgi:hypothetical protein